MISFMISSLLYYTIFFIIIKEVLKVENKNVECVFNIFAVSECDT